MQNLDPQGQGMTKSKCKMLVSLSCVLIQIVRVVQPFNPFFLSLFNSGDVYLSKLSNPSYTWRELIIIHRKSSQECQQKFLATLSCCEEQRRIHLFGIRAPEKNSPRVTFHQFNPIGMNPKQYSFPLGEIHYSLFIISSNWVELTECDENMVNLMKFFPEGACLPI